MANPMPKIIIQPLHGSFPTPSLENATVGDAMHAGIVACGIDATAAEVGRIMVAHHVHCVVVMHEAQTASYAPYVWGIVSDLDLIRACLDRGTESTAGALAGQPTISVKTTSPLRDAADLMVRHGASHVVATHPETLRPVGVLSTLDVARILVWGEA
jgi:CBS domain-containing protein